MTPPYRIKSQFGGASQPAGRYNLSPKKKKAHPEHDIQVAFFAHVRGLQVLIPELALAHAPKNDFKRTGNAKRDFAHWAYLKAEGVVAGVPDIHIPLAGALGKSFWLELKAPGNYPTDEQEKFMEMLEGQGHFADWTDSAEKAIEWLDIHLGPWLLERKIEVKGKPNAK